MIRKKTGQPIIKYGAGGRPPRRSSCLAARVSSAVMLCRSWVRVNFIALDCLVLSRIRRITTIILRARINVTLSRSQQPSKAHMLSSPTATKTPIYTLSSPHHNYVLALTPPRIFTIHSSTSIHYQEFDLKDRQTLVECVRHSDIVYNLIGRNYETKNFTFENINLDAARAIAEVSAEAGVARYVHVSALNAEESSPSRFLRTK
ncbi:hypothetical protein BC938DRAFT_476261, partial [Jimgerdemannia flammicorona]